MKSKEKRYSMFLQITKFRAPIVDSKKEFKKNSMKKVAFVEVNENNEVSITKPSEKKLKIKV